MLFDSGKSELVKEAYPVVDKIALILENYKKNIIEIEGHTDNVPISSSAKYEDNNVLSMYRALSVADYLRAKKKLNPAYVKSSGRGEYVPIADNSTSEGRGHSILCLVLCHHIHAWGGAYPYAEKAGRQKSYDQSKKPLDSVATS